MRCHHFESGACRSCTLLDLPRPRQIAEGRARVEQLLGPHLAPGLADAAVWGEAIVGPEAGFRARGKMAVGGTAAAPVLTLPGQSAGTDLCDCPLYPDGVEEVLAGAKALIRRAQVPPYDVARRRGEIKNVLVTASPDGEHLLRLVLRSEKALGRIREHLPRLLEAHSSVVAVTANIHPDHTTAVEGTQEIHLAGAASIAIRTGDVTLFSRPQSFLQTNTEVAGQLYRQGAAWAAEIAAAHGAAPRVWDLYCGLGGFALHIARAVPSAQVTGVEVSGHAIEGAREAAAASGMGPTDPDAAAASSGAARPTDADSSGAGPAGARSPRFLAADATAWATAEAEGPDGPPEIVVVNPPRRGLGDELVGWLERSGVRDVIYSTCHPATLAADLAAMPSLRITAGRWVDMFPHTAHAEVIVRLRRTDAD